MAQPPRLDGAVVSVHGVAGPAGVGFLVTEDAVITCVHVVCQALGLPPDHPDPPTEPVTLEFLLLDGGRVNAEVATWRPNPDDIAVLRLTGQPPAGAEPVRLSTAEDLWGHQVAAFGVPKDNEEGAWATGELRGHRAGGLIQVDDNRATGFTIQQGFSGSPVWDEDAGGVVGMVISANQRRRFACIVPTSALTDLWPPASLLFSPYRGLLSFREQDATLYYGRDALADTLAKDVRARRVTVVVGPSGYGKSSLVAAGVLPRLRDRPELSVAGPIRPRGNPTHEVAGALLELLQPDATPAQQLADRPAVAEMIAGGRLDEVVDRLLDRTGANELLLIVDQLEEALERGSAAVAALSPVIRCAFAPESRLRVLLVIRSDFLDRALAKPELAEGLREACTVGAMTREQLHAAVTGPLRGGGVTFETGLDELIVAEVADAPGQLPLLQSVLDQLWQRQERGKLTHRAYTDLGGVSGALARYAEEKGWLELEPGDQAVARQLFMRLVRIDPDLPTTRRPVRRDQLGEQEWRLAQRLVAARLLVSGRRETVELAHEALISHWDRLRDWIDEDREFQVWKEGFEERADRWQRGGSRPRDLLKKAELPQAEHWLRTRPDDLHPIERLLIRRSLGARRARWVKAAITITVVAAMIGGFLADLHYKWLPELFGNPAVRLANEVANDQSLTDTLLLKAIAAYNTDPDSPATVDELFIRYDDTRLATSILTEPRSNVGIDEVVASDDGRVVVTRSAAGATLWRESDGRMVPTKLAAPAPDDIAVTTDGTLVALAGDRNVRLFDGHGRRIRDFPVLQSDGGAPARMTVAVTAGMVASWSSDDSVVRVWSVAGQEFAPLTVGRATKLRMWFASDHRTLVTWTAESAKVLAWNPETAIPRPIADASDMAVMNTTGDTLVTCQADSWMRLHKLTDPVHSTELTDFYEDCEGLAIDPSGRYLGSSSESGSSIYSVTEQRFVTNHALAGPPPAQITAPVLIPGPDGFQTMHPTGPSVLMYSLRFDYLESYPYFPVAGAISRDGGRLATAAALNENSLLALWDSHSHELVKEVRTPGGASSIEFDASGQYLVITFTNRHEAEIRAVPSLELIHTISLPTSEKLAPPLVGLDARGHLLTSHGNEIERWKLATGKRSGQLLRADAPESQRGATVFAVAPDGGQVVAVSPDGRGLVVWRFPSHQPPRHVRVAGVTVTGVISTPWPDRVLVLRSDINSRVLELWDLAESEPVRTELQDDLNPEYSVNQLQESVAFDRDRIIRVNSRGLHTWNPTGTGHVHVIDLYTSSTPLAVHGMTVLWNHSYGPSTADVMEPDRWRDRLCELLGTPDPAKVADLPAGIDTTGLCV